MRGKRRGTEQKSAPFWYYLANFLSIRKNRSNFAPSNKKRMKIELQLIAAFVLSIGGLVLLFCGIFIDPQGEIHETLLVAFGETATFAGALFGIDYVYKKKK